MFVKVMSLGGSLDGTRSLAVAALKLRVKR